MHEKYIPTCKTATDTKQCVQDLKFKGFTKKDLFLELTESFPVLYFLKQNFISIEHWNGWKQGSVFCFLFLFFFDCLASSAILEIQSGDLLMDISVEGRTQQVSPASPLPPRHPLRTLTSLSWSWKQPVGSIIWLWVWTVLCSEE